MNNINEEWRTVYKYPNYDVSNMGRVMKMNTGKLLKNTTGINGYSMVGLVNYNGKKVFSIHRLVCNEFIENPDNKPSVDHIDNDRSNNHVENLRWATAQENGMNRTCHQPHSSKYKGVGWHKSISKWRAQIRFNYKSIHIGSFYDEKYAGRAYNLKAIQLFGEYANLNIISDDEDDEE